MESPGDPKEPDAFSDLVGGRGDRRPYLRSASRTPSPRSFAFSPRSRWPRSFRSGFWLRPSSALSISATKNGGASPRSASSSAAFTSPGYPSGAPARRRATTSICWSITLLSCADSCGRRGKNPVILLGGTGFVGTAQSDRTLVYDASGEYGRSRRQREDRIWQKGNPASHRQFLSGRRLDLLRRALGGTGKILARLD